MPITHRNHNSTTQLLHSPHDPNTIHCRRIRRQSSMTAPSMTRRIESRENTRPSWLTCCFCGSEPRRKPSIHRLDLPAEVEANEQQHRNSIDKQKEIGHPGTTDPPTNGSHPISTKAPGKQTSMDFGDVVIKLMAEEEKFEKRKKYKSMFKDAPLYQDLEPKDPDHPAVKLAPNTPHVNTNALEFGDTWFCPIDSDLNDVDLRSKFDPAESAHKSLEYWKTQTGAQPKSPLRPSGGPRSPVPILTDTRSRPFSPPYHTVGKSSSPRPVQRTASDPMEMKKFLNEIAGTGPNRAMWCTMPQTQSLVPKLSNVQKKQQEALFEILTSEASYYRSLTVLIDAFYKAPTMQPGTPRAVITPTEKHHLFSNVLEIHMTSESFLRAMEMSFREDPWMVNLFEILYKHVEKDFLSYETYVQNQMYQTRTLCKLQQHQAFKEAVRQIKSQPDCAFLDLNSFLLLPMQRVTRLRLLTSTVLKYAVKSTAVYKSGLVALAALEYFIEKCDAKKSYMEQKERLMELTIRFEYKLNAKAVATEGRRLIKEGELRLVGVNNQTSSTFQRRLSSIRRPKLAWASLFLFNDLLVIAKKRNNDNLMVDDSCFLNEIRIRNAHVPPGFSVVRHYPTEAANGQDLHVNRPEKNGSDHTSSVPNTPLHDSYLFAFDLIIEHPNQSRVEYKFEAKSLSERERWIDALKPPNHIISNELLIRDCPQILVTRSYSALTGDELELKEGDSACLLVSLSDGWYKGMVQGGRKGWFPENVCVLVDDATTKREQMENYHLLEQARAAYKHRKASETYVEFQTVGGARQSARARHHHD